MESESRALQTWRATSPLALDVRSARAALAEHLSRADAIEVVAEMLRGFPNSGAAGGEYLEALAEVVSSLPAAIAARAADPVRGVPSRTRFLPTPLDVIQWAQPWLEVLRGLVSRDDRERAQRETLLALDHTSTPREARPTLDQLQRKHGRTWGLAGVDDEVAHRERRRAAFAEANDRLLQREGPSGGLVPVSEGLRKILNPQPQTKSGDRAAA